MQPSVTLVMSWLKYAEIKIETIYFDRIKVFISAVETDDPSEWSLYGVS